MLLSSIFVICSFHVALCRHLRASVSLPNCSVSQIHLAQGSMPYSMIVSWMTPSIECSSTVLISEHVPNQFDTIYANLNNPAISYQINGYTSGYFHHILLNGLMPDTQYYYLCGDAMDIHHFTTLPSIGNSAPLHFAVLGDLGQTSDSAATINHIQTNSHIQMILHAGDLSYADCKQPLWDTYATMIEPLSQNLPWMVCAGNHEIEYYPDDHRLFLAFETRYRMPETQPYQLGNITLPSATNPYTGNPYCTPSIFQVEYDYGNSYYSFETGLVHVVYLNPYALTSPNSQQYKWLQQDLMSVDRTKTPWVIAVFHCPWYSSNQNHYGDTQTVWMRNAMETLFYRFNVNMAFSGHVHAYERTYPVFQNKTDTKGTVYITIGDGGNLEGHDAKYYEQPEWSAFRNGTEYGYGTLTVLPTKLWWKWYRNEDKQFVFRDEMVVCNSFFGDANCR